MPPAAVHASPKRWRHVGSRGRGAASFQTAHAVRRTPRVERNTQEYDVMCRMRQPRARKYWGRRREARRSQTPCAWFGGAPGLAASRSTWSGARGPGAPYWRGVAEALPLAVPTRPPYDEVLVQFHVHARAGLQMGVQAIYPPLLDGAKYAATTRGLIGLPCRVAIDVVLRAGTAHAARDVPHDERGKRHGGAMRPHGR